MSYILGRKDPTKNVATNTKKNPFHGLAHGLTRVYNYLQYNSVRHFDTLTINMKTW